jgi:hypothetical protein
VLLTIGTALEKRRLVTASTRLKQQLRVLALTGRRKVNMSIDETAGLDMMPEEDNSITPDHSWELTWNSWIVRSQGENETYNPSNLYAGVSQDAAIPELRE